MSPTLLKVFGFPCYLLMRYVLYSIILCRLGLSGLNADKSN